MPSTDLLGRSLAGEPPDLTVSLRQPVFARKHPWVKGSELFKQTGTRMALVVEYGVVQGLVTLNDILVEIVRRSSADELKNRKR